MADDAGKPPPDFYKTAQELFASAINLIDEHIRIVQYAIYGTGIAGTIVILRSAKSFSKFAGAMDIPSEFVDKRVSIYGRVRHIDTALPTKTSSSLQNVSALLLPRGKTEAPLISGGRGRTTNTDSSANGKLPSLSSSETLEPSKENGSSKVEKWKTQDFRLAQAQSGFRRRETVLKLHSGPSMEKGAFNETYELCPLYLQVDHRPIISLPLTKKKEGYLSIQMSGIEVTRDGLEAAKSELLDRKVWFVAYSRDEDQDSLLCQVKLAKWISWEIYNVRLVKDGLALVTSPEILDDRFYNKFYQKLLKAQQRAEKHKLGIWSVERAKMAIIRKLWNKIRDIFRRT